MKYSGWRFAIEHPYISAFVVLGVSYFVMQSAVYIAHSLRKGDK